MKNKQIFRKEALARLNTPEQFNETYKATSPSMWIIFAALAVLTAGILYLLFFGELEVYINARGISNQEGSYCWVPLSDAENLKPGMVVMTNNGTGNVTAISQKADTYDDIYALVGDEVKWIGISDNNRYYRVTMNVPYNRDQRQTFHIVLNVYSPIELVLNLNDVQ